MSLIEEEFARRVAAGDPLSDEEVQELFEILRTLRKRADQQKRLLESLRRRRWGDWVAGALVGLVLTIMAHLLGLAV